jgi:hypothetical protein
MDFVTLLVRSLSVFVLEMNSSRSRTINSVIASHVPANALGFPFPNPDEPEPPIPSTTSLGASKLTPELSLSSMASLAGITSTSLPPAPLVPRQHPPTPPIVNIDHDMQILTSPPSNYPTSSMEVSAPVLTTFSPSATPDISSPIGTPTPANVGTPTPPSPDLSGVPPLLVEAASPSPSPSSPSHSTELPLEGATPPAIFSPPPASPAPAAPTLTVTPTLGKTHSSRATLSRPHSNAPAGRIPLDYHFEFLLAVSSLDAPLASLLFDIPTLQALQVFPLPLSSFLF